MATEKLSVILELVASQFKKEAKAAADATGTLADRLDKAGRMATNVGAKLTTGLTLPLAGLAVGAVKAASNLGESMNAIGVVFGEASKKVEEFGETAAHSAGLSQRAFNEAVVPIGQLLNNFGLSADESANAVLTLTQRAADLGSTLNITTEEALAKFQAGLAGEAEPLKAFGIDVSVAALQAEALALGLIKAGEPLDKASRAQAAMSIILRESAFAAGDFANTLEGSLPNQMKELKANAENIAAALGEQMLPAILDVVKGIQGLVDEFTELDDKQQEFIVKTGLTVGALGPAAFAIGKLIGLIKTLKVAIAGIGGWAGLGATFSWVPSATPWWAKLGSAIAIAGAHMEILNEALDTRQTDEQRAATAELAAHMEDVAVRIREVQAAASDSAGIDSWNRGTREAVEIHDSWNTGLAHTQAGLDALPVPMSEAYEAALTLAEGNRAAAKSYRDDLTDAIAGFVTFFDGAVEEIKTSLTEMEANWKARTTQNERFWNGILILQQAGLDDLVEMFRAEGPAAAGAIEDLVADMDRAFDWERRIEENERQAAALVNALANAAAGEMDTIGAKFNAFGVSLADQLEAGFSTADLSNTLAQLMDIAKPSGVSTPGGGGSQFEKFDSGGIIPGPLGSQQLILAHGGETILPTHKTGAMGGSTTIVVQSPMGNFRQDLQYATILASVTNLVEGF